MPSAWLLIRTSWLLDTAQVHLSSNRFHFVLLDGMETTVKDADLNPTVKVTAAAEGAHALPNGSVEDAVAASPVTIFTKQHCPFCLEVKRTFDSLGVPYTCYGLDTIENGAQAHASLKTSTGQNTVPYVFIGGKLLGGCDATKSAQADGSLLKLLAAAGIFPKAQSSAGSALLAGTKRALSTLFAFPEIVDDRSARFNGIWGFVICLLVAIFYKRVQAHWVMGGLMVDFLLRFLGGGNISPLGSLSAVCCAVMELFGSKPRWVAGQSKQFASLCGLMFSALAFFFFQTSSHEDKLNKVGLAFTCALGAATFMEGFLGFCLGCWMFSLAINLGFLPADTFMVYTNMRDEASYTWEDMNKRLNEPTPACHRRSLHPDGKTETQIDYQYKAKSDDYTREDFHIIKHVKMSHFMLHMGLAGAASAWKWASPFESLYAPAPVYEATALTAAFLFVVWLCLYALKCIQYPHKVHKEWMHNVSGNLFTVPLATTVLFAYLVVDHSRTFANILFWIGAPAALALSIVRIGDWIALRKDLEHLNASWMVMPVANAVAALVGPIVEVKYRDACQFWFALAFMMWLTLFAATFYKAIIQIDEDDRVRGSMGAWVAAPAVLGVAYVVLYQTLSISSAGDASWNDFIFINLNWFSVALALIFLWCFVRPYFGRMRFDMSYWGAGFPSAALALVTITYYQLRRGDLSKGVAVTALAATSAINVVLALQTLAALLRRRVFVPDYKWGPLSFMRLTHEALRAAIKNLINMAEVAVSSGAPIDVVVAMGEAWRMMGIAHDEHSKHEDQVIFKLYDEFFPGIAKSYNDEHEGHHAVIHQLDTLMATLKQTPTAGNAQAVLDSLRQYATELETHLKHEEDHLIGMPRKHINLTLHKDTVRKCWSLTPAATWYELLPWIVNNLPMLHQRVRFIKTLLWALPERGQHIGMMVGMGVDAVQWRRVTDELPEIIPRGAEGWTRFY